MSHYSVLVIGEDPEYSLEPFSEHLEVDNTISKEELIAKEKASIPRYQDMYDAFNKDPEEYKKIHGRNQNHIDFIEKEVGLMLNDWTDADWYAKAIKYYDEEDLDAAGGYMSTYNPNSQWDWYQIGGRWSGELRLKPRAISGEKGERSWTNEAEDIDDEHVDSALKRDIDWEHPDMKDFISFAFLDKNCKWHEEGTMGMFGTSTIEEEDWPKRFKELLAEVGDDERITVVDCHI